MKVTLTYSKVFKLNSEIASYLKKEGFLDEKGFTNKPKTKMLVACKNVLKQTNDIFEEYNEAIQNFRIDFALEDEKTKAILCEADGNYKYSKDGLKNLNAKIKEFKETEVTIHQRLVEGIENLLEDYESFNDIFIIKVEKEKEPKGK